MLLIQATKRVPCRVRSKTESPCLHRAVVSRLSLSFPEAARRNGIRSDRRRYYDALDELEYEGAIEWDPSARYARGDKHYLITKRGLDGVLGR